MELTFIGALTLFLCFVTYRVAFAYALVYRGLLAALAFTLVGIYAARGGVDDFYAGMLVLTPCGILGAMAGKRAKNAKALTEVEKYHAEKARKAADAKWSEW